MKLLLATIFVMGLMSTPAMACDKSEFAPICKDFKPVYKSMGDVRYEHPNMSEEAARAVQEKICNCSNYRKWQKKKAQKRCRGRCFWRY